MKRILIIGDSDKINVNEISKAIGESVEIVTDPLASDIDLILDTPEPFIIKEHPKVEMPFYPKAKHMPKGHQKPYKYHK